jgi:hypothetical protein
MVVYKFVREISDSYLFDLGRALDIKQLSHGLNLNSISNSKISNKEDRSA